MVISSGEAAQADTCPSVSIDYNSNAPGQMYASSSGHWNLYVGPSTSCSTRGTLPSDENIIAFCSYKNSAGNYWDWVEDQASAAQGWVSADNLTVFFQCSRVLIDLAT
jgi:uncharacterized protein YraI